MNELVSVIMPSYNCGAYIRDSIQSVINQTYENWELLIVDDCSTDGTREILDALSDRRIRVLYNEKNSGAALSRNRALREAQSRYIAFLDSDDLWHPEKLARQLHFMEQNGYAFTYTEYEEIDGAGQPLGVRITGPRRITRRGMFRYCWPGCLSVVYDAEKIGLVQIADIRKNNDYALWLQICRKADCFLLPVSLAFYRRGREGSISSQRLLTMIRWHYRLFRQAEGEGVARSLWHTGGNLLFGCYKKLCYQERIPR